MCRNKKNISFFCHIHSNTVHCMTCREMLFMTDLHTEAKNSNLIRKQYHTISEMQECRSCETVKKYLKNTLVCNVQNVKEF